MTQPPQDETARGGEALEAARREKLRKIEEMGIDPWGGRFDQQQPIGQVRARESEITVEPPGDCATGRPPEEQGPRVCAAGRIVLQRKAGKLVFLDIQDWTGRVQAMIGKKQVGERNWELAGCFDLGDIIGVEGELKHTRTGELTIFVDSLHFLTKSLEPPPAKHKGIRDPELRQRRRYLDLIHTEGVRERFLRRTKIVQSIRNTLGAEGFVEVEGPTLQTVAGGAAARPFTTHHNALDIDLTLRIALELHLKRLLVGGIERVFELGRVYRNEGISPRHNPEFTMLEVYQAYGNYETMMELTEKLVVEAVQAAGQGKEGTGPFCRNGPEGASHKRVPSPFSELKLAWGESEIDFTPPFARKTYDELFREQTGVDPADAAAVSEYAKGIDLQPVGKHPDVVKSEIFEAKVEDALTGPVFVLDYPASICPLTKRKRDNPAVAERFELFIRGMEIANAYTELNDPAVQEANFRRQVRGEAQGETMRVMDEDFVTALRHGMPPAGGLGIGIDRVIMLLTDTPSIRDVVLFPLLRPQQ